MQDNLTISRVVFAVASEATILIFPVTEHTCFCTIEKWTRDTAEHQPGLFLHINVFIELNNELLSNLKIMLLLR